MSTRKVLNFSAWIIVSLILTWFYRCATEGQQPSDGAPKKTKSAFDLSAIQDIAQSNAQELLIKTCGSPYGYKVKDGQVYCSNGQPVIGVTEQMLKDK